MNKFVMAFMWTFVLLGAGGQAFAHSAPQTDLTKQQGQTSTSNAPAKWADSVPVCVQYGDPKRGGTKSWGCNY